MNHKSQFVEQRQDASPLNQARSLIEANPCFCHGAGHFEFELTGSVLVVSGRLPSFYLKQLLQNALAKVEGVERIDNRVQVISSAGLSSLKNENGSVFKAPKSPTEVSNGKAGDAPVEKLKEDALDCGREDEAARKDVTSEVHLLRRSEGRTKDDGLHNQG
jgi:hypothetical protein